MAPILVQPTRAGNSTGTTTTVSITTTAGNSLIAQITVWMTGNNPASIASVVDSAGNTWTVSTAQQSQYPPAAGSFSSSNSQYGFSATAWCLPSGNRGTTKSITTVTITLAGIGTGVFWEAGVSEFSGLPTGSVALTAASKNVLATAVSSYTTPTIYTNVTTLGIANTADFGEFTGISSGWVINNYGDTISGYSLSVPAGNVSVTFTQSTTGDVPSSAIVAFGPPLPEPLMAGIV